MALLTRKMAALSMLFKSSFGVFTDISISFLYTASNASSRYDQVLEYAPETWTQNKYYNINSTFIYRNILRRTCELGHEIPRCFPQERGFY